MSNSLEAIELTTRQCSRLLEKTLTARINTMFVSSPGLGKTSIVYQVAEKLGWKVITFHPVISDPTDFKGMPWVLEMPDGSHKAVFLPFNELEKLCNADSPTLAFFDDLGQAAPSVQAPLMQLWQAKKINGIEISDQVAFIGATNRRQDKAGVKSIIEPLKSRMILIHMIADADEWAEDFANKHLSPEITAFVRKHRPELLNKFEPTPDMTNSPCPRGWENLDSLYRLRMDSDLELAAYAGAVGGGAAREFIGYLQIFRKLVLPEDILKDPENTRVPQEPAILWATCTALARKADTKTIDAIVKYGNRMPAEFNTMLILDCLSVTKNTSGNSPLLKTRAVMEWASRHSDMIL